MDDTTNPDRITIDLEKPIATDGDNKVSQLTLTRPYSGHLRGLSVRDVLNFDSLSLLELLPRITEPPFHKPFHARLTLVDMVRIGDGIAYFLGATPANADSPTA